MMRQRILESLAEIERESHVRILYACESGSRAWGIASTDSDFDVRFIYVRPAEAYLRLEEPRDVIEKPIVDELDINGWDLRKTLRLFHKSNPVLMEWLDSPIVYQESTSIAQRIREQTPSIFQPMTAYHHYFSMAKGTYSDSLKGQEVSTKKYFYALRPLFAVMWIESGLGPVPTEFGKLMNHLPLDSALVAEIESLLDRKKRGVERGRGPRIEPISAFIEQEIERRERMKPDLKGNKIDPAPLDRLFRDGIEEAWSKTN